MSTHPSAVIGAVGCRPVVCAECGAALRRTRTGRPRLTCSDRCRRAVDHRRRKLRRRREALDAWRALARTRDPRDHMQHEIRDLRAALDAWQDVAMAHIRRETRALRAEIAALTRGHSHEVVDRGSVSGHPGRLRVRRPELPSELAIVDPAGRTAKDDAR